MPNSAVFFIALQARTVTACIFPTHSRAISAGLGGALWAIAGAEIKPLIITTTARKILESLIDLSSS
jgi:hypothetical protein